MRTAAIARKFLDEGNKVTYATTTPETAKEVCPEKTEVVTLCSRSDPSPFVEWIRDNQPDAALIDAYPADTVYQQKINELVPLAVYADDARHSICADVLINGNLYAPNLAYEFVGDSPKQLLGSDFVPLRDEIRLYADQEPPWRDPPRCTLITMGGSDIENRTPAVIRSFDGLDLHVDAIVGPGFSEQQENEIHVAAENTAVSASVARNPDDLAERMFQADIAVSTASSTTYELLALGTPIVCQPVAKNQEPIATALGKHNVATIVKQEAENIEFWQAINQYLSNPSLRKSRSKLGRELVDGDGIERIFAEIILMSQERR
jgi:spore coat polysaccharide biosynthesis predicted glycosyltransferase SpsG